MAHRIFISYRRSDTRHPARALYDRLKGEFGAADVFYDVDTIDLGADFPEVLVQAVGGAQVVLAVMGDQWQSTLVQNAKQRSRKDYVREELKQAGQRLALGESLLLVPVLIDAGRGFDPDALPASLKKDLTAVRKANGISFADGSWEQDFQRLLTAIKSFLASQPAPAKSLDIFRAEALKAVQGLLQHATLQGLAKHWSPDATAMAEPASQQLLKLRRGILAWQAAGQSPVNDPTIRAKCMLLVSLLARLAVNHAAAAAVLKTKQALPCQQSGVAALVRAVAQGHPLVLLPTIEGYNFRSQRVADANVALDPGSGTPWLKDLALQFWNALFPHDMRTDLTDYEIKLFSRTLRNRTEEEGSPFMVLCPANWGRLDQARSKSEELNAVPVVWAEAANGSTTVLYEDEMDLVAAIKDCIEATGKL